MRRHLRSILGAAALLAFALLLNLAPPDRESLFLDGAQKSAAEAWQELLRGPRDAADAAPQLRLTSVELDPHFVAAHVQDGEEPLRQDALRRALAEGRDPERAILHRVRQAHRALASAWSDDGIPVEMRYAPPLWPGEPAHADAASALLLVKPGFAERDGRPGTSLVLELVDASGRRLALGDGEHAWPSASALWPPLLAVALALFLQRTIPALLLAVLLGCWLLQPGAGELLARAAATAHAFGVDILWQRVLLDQFRIEVLLFVVFLSMAVGIMSRAGGIHGMVALLSRFAVGPRSTQLVAYLGGLLVFFDDYANCIILGNTMRPLADRRGVSREKLAYLVDSTAAPIAAISVFSTWIVYEISMYAPQLAEVNPLWSEADGFAIFLRTLPYRFYCLLTLLFIPLALLLRRELGPMLRAERRARHLGQPIDPRGRPLVATGGADLEPLHPARARARDALAPILALVLVTIGTLLWTGRSGDVAGADLATRLRGILRAADATRAILCGSIACCALAFLLALLGRRLGAREAATAARRSAQSLIFALAILLLAWSIGAICDQLETASYLVAITRDWILPELLPAVLFLTACGISFAVGSSWSTMAILLPNVVVLAWVLGERSALGSEGLLVLSIGAVLEGAIFGDHCSPISDTTLLSSLATASDHLHHVRTQMPYALLAMAVALAVGYLPVALLGLSPGPCLAAGVAALAGILLTAGGDPADPPPVGDGS